MTERVTVLLAAKNDRARAWYQALHGDARFDILTYSVDWADLQHKLGSMAPEVLILDSALSNGPDVLVEMLAELDAAVFVLLPAETREEILNEVRAIPAVKGGWCGDFDLVESAGSIYQAALEVRGAGSRPQQVARPEPRAQPAPPPQDADVPLRVVADQPVVGPPPPPPPPSRGAIGVVAFWSGPAGGTGRTTLSLALGILASEWEHDAVLLAFSEPALLSYLHLPRVPNATTYFEEPDHLSRAEQAVTWKRKDGQPVALRVVLGPTHSRDGAVGQEQIGALIGEARTAHEVVIVDLPALPPGGNAWTLEPLMRASDVMLVMPPSVVGVSATVSALATLRDIRAPGHPRLVLNRRHAGGLSTKDFTRGVHALWGDCPEVVVEVDFQAGLSDRLDQAQLPDQEAFVGMVGPMARVVGLSEPDPGPGDAKGKKTGGFSLGRIRLRVTG